MMLFFSLSSSLPLVVSSSSISSIFIYLSFLSFFGPSKNVIINISPKYIPHCNMSNMHFGAILTVKSKYLLLVSETMTVTR
jgi:hypothetical protein